MPAAHAARYTRLPHTPAPGEATVPAVLGRLVTAASWTQLTALTELQLRCGSGPVPGSAPASLGGMTSVRKLCIQGAMIYDLPTDPYLSRLESLELSNCSFMGGVPVSLAAAAQLHHLGLPPGSAYGRTHRVCLTYSDVAVLSSMLALATLILKKPRDWKLFLCDFVLGRLRAACIAKGNAPPAVSEGDQI